MDSGRSLMKVSSLVNLPRLSLSQGWVWSAPTETGHFEKSMLKKQHQRAIYASRVRLFVLYTL